MVRKLNKKEIMDYLWEEIKLRQEQYWSSFNKFAVVIMAVLLAPYLWPGIAATFGDIVLLFPALSILLSVVCTWYLGAEYQRLSMVRLAYEELLYKDCFIPRMPRKSIWDRIVAWRIGMATSVIWGIGFTGISLFNLFWLLR